MSDIKNMLTTWVDNETWVDSKNLTAINNVAVQMADDIEVLSRVAATTHSEVEAIQTSLDNLESEVNELKEGNINIDLTNYATKTELSLKVDKVNGKSLISDSEIERLSTLKNYDDTDIKNTLNSKANKTELHSHTNKTVLDGISSAKVTEWNNKSTFSGNYNDLTNKPTIPTLNGYATEQYVNEEIKKIDVTQQLTDYAKKSELHSHSNKSVLDGITSTKITEWNNKSTFDGNYNSLTNKPTMPTKISQLTNDSGFITSIPSEYVTETELNNKGYLTQHQDISGKLDKTHNTANDSHNDIRLLISGLTNRLNALADSDDTTLDQLSEIVVYIKNNKSLIDSITTNKINISDIIDNLTTSATNKPLSAKQGVQLKALIDTLTTELNTKANKSDLHSHTNKSVLDGITSAKITEWNNKSTFSGNYNDLTDKPTIQEPTSWAAYGTCDTDATTAEKVITVANKKWELKVGIIVGVKFSYSNTASNVTLNVNNTGAYPIWYSNSQYNGSSSTYAGYANRTNIYMFTGTHWQWISSGVYPSTVSNASLGQGYGTCTTSESTLAKVSTISSYSLAVGGVVSIKFTYGVSANSTLNITSKGAKPIFYRGVAITNGIIKAGDTATFIYNGTQYHLISLDTAFTHTHSQYAIDNQVVKANDYNDGGAAEPTLSSKANRTTDLKKLFHNNQSFFPLAHEDGVIDSSGTKLSSKISNLSYNISTKVDRTSYETWTFKLEDGSTITKKVVVVK